MLTLELPYASTIPNGVYIPTELHVEVRLRNVIVSRAFKRLWIAAQAHKLNSGRPVYSAANVVEWIIEKIAGAMEQGDNATESN
jgi:hypothetical protein